MIVQPDCAPTYLCVETTGRRIYRLPHHLSFLEPRPRGYVVSKNEDNDSNERDPFTDRSFNFFDLGKDWGPSDRDIRHKVNVFGYFLPGGGVQASSRVQYRGPQPITPTPRMLNGVDRGRNSERKENEFFTSTGGSRDQSASRTATRSRR
jgi:hypothetical protein